jgi:hippurate hydrolase
MRSTPRSTRPGSEAQLTVRSDDDDVRGPLLAAIGRIVDAEAEAGGATRPPDVVVDRGPSATINDPALTARLASAVTRALGAENVVEGRPRMGAEDFSEYGRAGVPAVARWVGAADR